MEKYKKYYGIILFIATILILGYLANNQIQPRLEKSSSLEMKIKKSENNLKEKKEQLQIVKNKIKKIKDSITTSQKKIYSPIESDLGNETLFFTLYNDTIEMIKSNSVKIKSIDYTYNPESDEFVRFGKDVYFVCDINLELVSNYVNLGKLIQDIYQYPYYIKINSLDIKPYEKDKKILLSDLSLRLYAHTSPKEIQE